MRTSAALCLSSLLALLAVPARAQEPAPGVRAAGMGGAFTAVADDASAVYWNPAGLASGAFFSLVLDRNDAGDNSASLLALGTPPLGLSYYRTATGPLTNGRNPLVAHHAGITVLQSLGGRLAIGGTAKLVHGTVSDASASVSTNKFDVDLGVMATGSLGRLGVTVHNLLEPDFSGPVSQVTLERRVRAGLALNTGKASMVAADVDLVGDIRQAAVGAELHSARKAWVRGGLSWTISGADARPLGSLGLSYAVYGSTMADVQVSFGSDDAPRGWGVGLRFVF